MKHVHLPRVLGVAALMSLAAACGGSSSSTEPPPGRLTLGTRDGCQGACGVVPNNEVIIEGWAFDDLAEKELEARTSNAFNAHVVRRIDDEAGGGRRAGARHYAFLVATGGVGDVDIGLFDESGRPVDTIHLAVREPKDLHVQVTNAGTVKGRSELVVRTDKPLELDVTMLDEGGALLRYSSPPWKVTTTDASVIEPSDENPALAFPRKAGSATLTLTAGAASRAIDLVVHVD